MVDEWLRTSNQIVRQSESLRARQIDSSIPTRPRARDFCQGQVRFRNGAVTVIYVLDDIEDRLRRPICKGAFMRKNHKVKAQDPTIQSTLAIAEETRNMARSSLAEIHDIMRTIADTRRVLHKTECLLGSNKPGSLPK